MKSNRKTTEVTEYTDQANRVISKEIRQWLKEGRCPQCGELGALDAQGGARCSVHGIYAMVMDPGSGSRPEYAPEVFLEIDEESLK